MDLKKQLRLKFRKWMNISINEEISLTAGDEILNKIKRKLTGIPNPKVSIFISKLPEINTVPLIDYLYEIGAHVFIPAWHSEEMWMCGVNNRNEFEDILKSSPSNKIPMPTTNCIPIESVLYDFIIVPGLVFDKNCHRLGYGYGHYDYFLSRYFSATPKAETHTKLIGVGYDEQIFDESLPFEDHDIKLNEIITPNNHFIN